MNFAPAFFRSKKDQTKNPFLAKFRKVPYYFLTSQKNPQKT